MILEPVEVKDSSSREIVNFALVVQHASIPVQVICTPGIMKKSISGSFRLIMNVQITASLKFLKVNIHLFLKFIFYPTPLIPLSESN
jgi:hypothetical protein